MELKTFLKTKKIDYDDEGLLITLQEIKEMLEEYAEITVNEYIDSNEGKKKILEMAEIINKK